MAHVDLFFVDIFKAWMHMWCGCKMLLTVTQASACARCHHHTALPHRSAMIANVHARTLRSDTHAHVPGCSILTRNRSFVNLRAVMLMYRMCVRFYARLQPLNVDVQCIAIVCVLQFQASVAAWGLIHAQTRSHGWSNTRHTSMYREATARVHVHCMSSTTSTSRGEI